MASDYRKVIRDYIGGDPEMVDAVVNAYEAELAELRAERDRLTTERDEANRRANAAQTLCSNQRVEIIWADKKIAEYEHVFRSQAKCNDDMERAMLAAEAERDRLQSFVRSFLNPEERGHAVPASVRGDVRELLGMKRVETTGEEPKR